MIVFLHGDNEVAIARHIRKLRDQYAQKFADSLEEVRVDAGEAKLSDLEQALLAQPMFFTHRLVVIFNLDAIKGETDAILKLLGSVPDSTVAVLDGRGLDRRSRLFKDLAKLSGAKAYPGLNPSERIAWIITEVKRQGATISRAQAEKLARRVGNNDWRLAMEIEKLAVLGGEIDDARIESLVTASLDDTVFDLIRLIREGQTAAALLTYDHLMAQGASDQQLIATMQWQYRVLALVVSRANDDELAASGVKPYAAQRARQDSRGLALTDVAKAYGALLMAEHSIKSGDKKAHQAMTDLVIELSSRV